MQLDQGELKKQLDSQQREIQRLQALLNSQKAPDSLEKRQIQLEVRKSMLIHSKKSRSLSRSNFSMDLSANEDNFSFADGKDGSKERLSRAKGDSMPSSPAILPQLVDRATAPQTND